MFCPEDDIREKVMGSPKTSESILLGPWISRRKSFISNMLHCFNPYCILALFRSVYVYEVILIHKCICIGLFKTLWTGRIAELFISMYLYGSSPAILLLLTDPGAVHLHPRCLDGSHSGEGDRSACQPASQLLQQHHDTRAQWQDTLGEAVQGEGSFIFHLTFGIKQQVLSWVISVQITS